VYFIGPAPKKSKGVPPGAGPQALLKKDSESDLKNGAVRYKARFSGVPGLTFSN